MDFDYDNYHNGVLCVMFLNYYEILMKYNIAGFRHNGSRACL